MLRSGYFGFWETRHNLLGNFAPVLKWKMSCVSHWLSDQGIKHLPRVSTLLPILHSPYRALSNDSRSWLINYTAQRYQDSLSRGLVPWNLMSAKTWKTKTVRRSPSRSPWASLVSQNLKRLSMTASTKLRNSGKSWHKRSFIARSMLRVGIRSHLIIKRVLMTCKPQHQLPSEWSEGWTRSQCPVLYSVLRNLFQYSRYISKL